MEATGSTGRSPPLPDPLSSTSATLDGQQQATKAQFGIEYREPVPPPTDREFLDFVFGQFVFKGRCRMYDMLNIMTQEPPAIKAQYTTLGVMSTSPLPKMLITSNGTSQRLTEMLARLQASMLMLS